MYVTLGFGWVVGLMRKPLRSQAAPPPGADFVAALPAWLEIFAAREMGPLFIMIDSIDLLGGLLLLVYIRLGLNSFVCRSPRCSAMAARQRARLRQNHRLLLTGSCTRCIFGRTTLASGLPFAHPS